MGKIISLSQNDSKDTEVYKSLKSSQKEFENLLELIEENLKLETNEKAHNNR